MATVGEMRHAAIVESTLMRIAEALEKLCKCFETLKEKDKDKNKENERDQDNHAVQFP